MKHTILATLAVIAISSSAQATEKNGEISSKKKPGSIYLRADLLGEKFNKVSMKTVGYKHTNYSYGIDFGLGYHATERLRLETIYNHNFITKFKLKSVSKIAIKADTKALFLRAMLDVISLDKVRLFVGAGGGISRTSHKAVGYNLPPIQSKASYSLAYSFHSGISANVADGVMLEIGYSMRNYGKTNNLKDSNGVSDKTRLKLRSRVVSLGLRFDV
jgi:opacity protein-like surface antigen